MGSFRCAGLQSRPCWTCCWGASAARGCKAGHVGGELPLRGAAKRSMLLGGELPLRRWGCKGRRADEELPLRGAAKRSVSVASFCPCEWLLLHCPAILVSCSQVSTVTDAGVVQYTASRRRGCNRTSAPPAPCQRRAATRVRVKLSCHVLKALLREGVPPCSAVRRRFGFFKKTSLKSLWHK